MIISAQVAIYPLRQDRLAPSITAVTSALEAAGLRAEVGPMSTTAAGPRLRAFRWASALFPDGLAGTPARIPLGDVIGVAVELAP